MAAGFAAGTTTVCCCIREAVDVLATLALSSRDAVVVATGEAFGWVSVVARFMARNTVNETATEVHGEPHDVG